MNDQIQVLAIGAHADDVEIGAGGTIARLVAAGFSVSVCILTDEADAAMASARHEEAKAAATQLGVEPQRVLFVGLPDGRLAADRDSIARIRGMLQSSNICPRIVISHSQRDSHNDHRSAAELTLSAFRKTCILHYFVPNSSVVNHLQPRVFVNTSDVREAKKAALQAHESQDKAGRILWELIEDVEREFGQRIETDRAEAFELTVQQGADDALSVVRSLNDCPFHQFWYGLLGDDPLINIHAVPVVRRRKEYDWPTDKDREGMSNLRRAFGRHWYGTVPIDEFSCGTERVEQFLYSAHILLSGGAVSNGITRNYFNHFRGLRYVIDYDMPDYRNIRIKDREDDAQILAEYEVDELGNRTPRVDRGILTVIRNPMVDDRFLVGCMGIHGFGSLGCYKTLSDRTLLREMLGRAPMPWVMPGAAGFQVIVDYDTRLSRASVDWDTLAVLSDSRS